LPVAFDGFVIRDTRIRAGLEGEAMAGRGKLLRDVATFQLKLLLSAGRDLVLLPLSLAAAAFDFVSGRTELFRATLTLGRWSDEFIGLFPHDRAARPSEVPYDADTLLAQIEGLVRDPKSGAEKAKLLSRWARMQLATKRPPEEPKP
jgi:hypothetical protein